MSRNKRNSSRRRAKVQRITAVEQCEQRVLLSGTPASIDGTGNNETNPELGSTDEQLLRLVNPEYTDGISTLAGADRPSARAISNAVADQDSSIINDRSLTDILWVWGQFIDHDIDLTTGATPAESVPIEVPTGDEFFDPFSTGTQTIGFERSVYDPASGTSTSNPRQQLNQITAFLDGSVVYGSDQVRADALRTFAGGKMRTSAGDLLPFNESGLENAGGNGSTLFLAGDVRANENIALTAMQTIWVREHNRLADEIAQGDPNLTDEEIYQQARAIVRSELQAITFNEYLPALLGQGAISEYQGYDSNIDPTISNIFSTAAYRFGHSVLPQFLLRSNADGSMASEGHIALRNAFFSPSEIINNGIDSVLRGATLQNTQELDTQVIDEVRNFLFGAPGSGGFDLVSLNIQRGRDHGLPDYNQARVDLGLPPVTSFSEISSDANVVAALASVYGNVDQIDAWVGMLSEDHLVGSSAGELMNAVIVDQFTRLRDGDRFWYQNQFSGQQLQDIEQTTLADVIERNSNVSNLQNNIFYDSSVMYFEIPGNQPFQDYRVRVRNEQVEIVDAKTKQVKASRPVAEVDKVIIAGRDQLNDRIIVEGSVSELAVPGGVDAWGGHQGDDTFFVGGTRHKDMFDISANNVNMNHNDLINNGFEKTIVDGMKGNDRITARGRHLDSHLKIIGGHGHDVIVGSAGHDHLFGGTGRDRIMGSMGHDLIKGGSSNDHLDGGAGNDFIYGEEGDDELFGRSGDDHLFGGPGNDLLDGGPGNNELHQDDPPPPSAMRHGNGKSHGGHHHADAEEELVRRFVPQAGLVQVVSESKQNEAESQPITKRPAQQQPATPQELQDLEELGLSALESLFTKP